MNTITSLVPMINGAYLLLVGLFSLCMLVGLTMINAGFIQSKNTTALLTKCMLGFAATCLIYLGWSHPFIYLNPSVTNPYFPSLQALWLGDHHWSDYINNLQQDIDLPAAFFRAIQASVLIMIVIGASAETLKIWALTWFAILFTAFIYPLLCYWTQGNGFLHVMGFVDHNGAATVYLAAAAAALAGSLLLGSRQNKYIRKPNMIRRKIKPIPGNNLPLACCGLFFLWIGTLAFNTSYLVNAQQLSIVNVGMIFLNTSTAAAAGLFIVAFITRILYRRIDVSLVINGGMLGLVALAASPIIANLTIALVFGLIAGIIGSFAIVVFDKLRIDDPLGAIGVFGIGGVWSLVNASYTIQSAPITSTSAVPWDRLTQFIVQIDGAAIIFSAAFIGSLIMWLLIKLILGLRMNKEVEVNGLDQLECGARAYPEFVTQDQRYWM